MLPQRALEIEWRHGMMMMLRGYANIICMPSHVCTFKREEQEKMRRNTCSQLALALLDTASTIDARLHRNRKKGMCLI